VTPGVGKPAKHERVAWGATFASRAPDVQTVHQEDVLARGQAATEKFLQVALEER